MAEFIDIDTEGEIDVETIMQQIKAYIMARKVAADAGLSHSMGRFDGRLAPELYEALYQLTMTYDQIAVPEMLSETSLPVVGRLWMAVRRQFHNLVRFYINRAAARQTAFNKHLLTLASELVKELEALPTAAEVTELRLEVERLLQQNLGQTSGQEGA